MLIEWWKDDFYILMMLIEHIVNIYSLSNDDLGEKKEKKRHIIRTNRKKKYKSKIKNQNHIK